MQINIKISGRISNPLQCISRSQKAVDIYIRKYDLDLKDINEICVHWCNTNEVKVFVVKKVNTDVYKIENKNVV